MATLAGVETRPRQNEVTLIGCQCSYSLSLASCRAGAGENIFSRQEKAWLAEDKSCPDCRVKTSPEQILITGAAGTAIAAGRPWYSAAMVPWYILGDQDPAQPLYMGLDRG